MSFFFFFKQKTAYEMRISDWSSDVCSSDLSEKLQRQEELKSVIEKAVCDATGSRQPPLHRVDLTSDRIVKLSKAAELLIANSLSLDGNHKLVGECIREVARVIEQNVGEMMKHLDRVADTDAQPQ